MYLPAIYTLVLSLHALAAPAASSSSSTSSAASATPTVPYASDDPNYSFYEDFNSGDDVVPEPIRGSTGATVIGQQNVPMEKQMADIFAPPSTDEGTVLNSKWSFTQSHNRLQTGGWARQQNEDDFPISTALAGVDMRLEAGAIRELHWHTAAEWSYVLAGTVQITAVDTEGRNYLANLNPGDLWYFPPGIPHSLQGTGADGCEFLLVFDSGTFSEDDTFLLTDWLAHVPKEVIAKSFQLDISVFDHIPGEQLYIFPSAEPPANDSVSSPYGTVPLPYSFPLSQVQATPLQGGSVKVVDSRTFNISTTIAAAEVTVDVGGIRELHWHPTEPEWTYFLQGEARITSFAASANARTYTYQAGDIAYIPPAYGHYVENLSNTTALKYLEIFNSDIYQDISLTQWLALTPPELVSAHLTIPVDIVKSFNKTKATVV